MNANHIEQTIADVERRIVELQALVTVLRTLEFVPGPSLTPQSVPDRPPIPDRGGEGIRKIHRGGGRRGKAKIPAVVVKSRGIRGPYKKRDVAAAGAVDVEPRPSPTPAAPFPKEAGAARTVEITTLGAAMKVEIARLGKFTRDELRKVIETKYGHEDFVKNGQSFDVNLSYWSSKEKLEKIGTGGLASYKVIDPEFFKLSED